MTRGSQSVTIAGARVEIGYRSKRKKMKLVGRRADFVERITSVTRRWLDVEEGHPYGSQRAYTPSQAPSSGRIVEL